jgi:hypothetical protein
MSTKRLHLIFSAAAVAMVALVAAGTASAQAPGMVLAHFSTPGSFDWKVPKGVKQVSFELFGAQGGNSVKANIFIAGGGQGGRAIATFAVQPGQLFQIIVGGRGGDNGEAGEPGGGGRGRFGGTGGGGATSVLAGCVTVSIPPLPPTTQCKPASSILVAGGGGGAIGAYTGGDGGGFSGDQGHAKCVDGSGRQYPCRGNGGGGRLTDEGIGGSHFPYWVCQDPNSVLHPLDVRVVTASSGSFGVGGWGGFDITTEPIPPREHCEDLRVPGSGGGGGWFGGGGSLNGQLVGIDPWGNKITAEIKGSGGGGSAYISPLAISGSTEGGVQIGNGRAVIRTAQ